MKESVLKEIEGTALLAQEYSNDTEDIRTIIKLCAEVRRQREKRIEERADVIYNQGDIRGEIHLSWSREMFMARARAEIDAEDNE